MTFSIAEVFDGSVHRGDVLGLLFETGRTTDVERTHRELRSGLADRLCSDDADSLADLDRIAGRKIAAVAFDADAASRFAGQGRADTDLLQAGKLNLAARSSSISTFALTITVPSTGSMMSSSDVQPTMRSRSLSTSSPLRMMASAQTPLERSAILFRNDHVLSDVDEAASQVTRIGRFQMPYRRDPYGHRASR